MQRSSHKEDSLPEPNPLLVLELVLETDPEPYVVLRHGMTTRPGEPSNSSPVTAKANAVIKTGKAHVMRVKVCSLRSNL